MLKTIAASDNSVDREALAAQLKPGAIKDAVTEMRALQVRAQAALGEPWPQCQAALKTIGDEALHSTHYLVRSNFPATVSIGEKQFSVATLHIMLDAALAHGPQLDEAAAATYHDAFGGDPLRLTKSAGGTLTLLTAQQHPVGKDLSLPLGK
ncbi:MAG: hypothetical protein WDN28_06370 [Chthoniobacter sp.]